ncbi:MAG TPA: RDD family protein [Bacteroidales bacterium]|nr:RDD family protein [Bacteroidales bacterium]
MPDFDILTSQNVSVKYDVAGVGNRIVALAIDFVLYAIWLLIFTVIQSFMSSTGKIMVMVLYSLPIAFYHPVMEIFFNGQSVGKMMMKIRVMKTDGTTPSVSSYLLRWVFRLIDISFSMGSIAVTTIAFTKKSQRVGDLAAGTTVIRLKERTSLKELVPVKKDENYQPVFSEVVTLTDQDIQLLKKVLYKQRHRWDGQLGDQMAVHIKKVTGISSDMNDKQLLETVLKDFEFFALQEKSVI